MARVGDLDKPPQVKAPKTPKVKSRRPDSQKTRSKKLAVEKRAVKTITVEVLGVSYIGWYWTENDRMYVTYHEQPKVAEARCGCCSAEGLSTTGHN